MVQNTRDFLVPLFQEEALSLTVVDGGELPTRNKVLWPDITGKWLIIMKCKDLSKFVLPFKVIT